MFFNTTCNTHVINCFYFATSVVSSVLITVTGVTVCDDETTGTEATTLAGTASTADFIAASSVRTRANVERMSAKVPGDSGAVKTASRVVATEGPTASTAVTTTGSTATTSAAARLNKEEMEAQDPMPRNPITTPTSTEIMMERISNSRAVSSTADIRLLDSAKHKKLKRNVSCILSTEEIIFGNAPKVFIPSPPSPPPLIRYN